MGDIVCTCLSGFVAAYGFHRKECPMHNPETCESCIEVNAILQQFAAEIASQILDDESQK